jgi:hypothetical protein
MCNRQLLGCFAVKRDRGVWNIVAPDPDPRQPAFNVIAVVQVPDRPAPPFDPIEGLAELVTAAREYNRGTLDHRDGQPPISFAPQGARGNAENSVIREISGAATPTFC